MQIIIFNIQVGATLDTLLKFLNWIPLGYIFETKLIQTLIVKELNKNTFIKLSKIVLNFKFLLADFRALFSMIVTFLKKNDCKCLMFIGSNRPLKRQTSKIYLEQLKIFCVCLYTFWNAFFQSKKKSFLFVFQFLSVPMFRNITMKCLTEIASVTVTHYDEKFVGELT